MCASSICASSMCALLICVLSMRTLSMCALSMCVLSMCALSMCALSMCTLLIPPWYNRTGWLGVKHQLTYLLTYVIDVCGIYVCVIDVCVIYVCVIDVCVIYVQSDWPSAEATAARNSRTRVTTATRPCDIALLILTRPPPWTLLRSKKRLH